MGIGAPVNSMQQQLAQQQALSAANQQRQLQDPRYARTQTPEFQAYVAQQKDLAGKMNSYMNPGQADPSLAQSMVMPPNAQNQNFMSDMQAAAQAAANRVSSLGPNQSPGYGDVRAASMPSVGGKGGGIGPQLKTPLSNDYASTFPGPSVAEETSPASMGGKGGYAGPRPAVMPQQTQRQPDTPSGLGGKGGASMPPQQMPSGYDQGFPAYQGPSSGSGGGGLGFGGGGGGQKKLTLGEVGLTFDPSGGGGGGAGGSMKAYAEGGNVSQGLGSLNAGNMGFMHSGKDGISSGEKLREIDILNAYFRQANVPPQQSLKMLQQVIQSGVKFKRDGNTMIGSKRISKDAAQVYFFTVDKLDGFIDSVKKLLGGLKRDGVKAVYMNKVDPSIVQALQSAGATPQQSDNPEYKIMAAI